MAQPMRRRRLLTLPLALLACGLLLPRAAAAPAEVAPSGFARSAVPFLETHCLRCHGEKVKKANLALNLYRDEKAVARDRKTWERVLHMVEEGEMPPSGRPRPPAADVEAFTRTVRAAFEQADRAARPDPGHVTVRRLNRTEYSNTIRDLVGVDFNPAEDFPADDVGNGFDNIGEVLSLSPVLMERYLAAAESIMQRAIVVGDPPKPPHRHLPAMFLSPSLGKEASYRSLDSKGDLSTLYKILVPGEYRLRTRAWARQAGDEPVRLAFTIDGKDVFTAEVKATEGKKEHYESPLFKLEEGEHRAAVAFLNPFTEPKAEKDGKAGPAHLIAQDLGTQGVAPGTPPLGPMMQILVAAKLAQSDAFALEGKAKRELSVEYLELEGPMDTYPPAHKRIMACDPALPKREQARQILTRFVTRAYRRPATPAEVERLLTLVDAAQARGDKWEAGIQTALEAVLVSPKFLFRVELDDRPDSPGPHPLDEHQLACRLSYFLWSSMPDDELSDLAARKQLTAKLDGQVRRMLKDPKAHALVDNFFMQWLQLRRLSTVAPDRKLFPTFDEDLRAAMSKETDLFVSEVVREDRSILDFLDADFTYLNRTLAKHYGIADTNGNRRGEKAVRPDGRPIFSNREFVRVSLADGERGGLLTQASVLTVTSNPTRTSPVKRGRWVLEQILGEPPPPPPPNVPELAETPQAVLSGSLRQRMEQHRANPSCAACHTRMDALGFALENFNAVGAFRTKDGDFPIDPSGTLPDGQSFKGPAELKTVLKGKKDLFARCLAEKMLTYALGRGLEPYDRPAVEKITQALAHDDYRFSTLVLGIARSDPFRLRRGKDEVK
jgi:mono/diheme cytochrome c family protein